MFILFKWVIFRFHVSFPGENLPPNGGFFMVIYHEKHAIKLKNPPKKKQIQVFPNQKKDLAGNSKKKRKTDPWDPQRPISWAGCGGTHQGSRRFVIRFAPGSLTTRPRKMEKWWVGRWIPFWRWLYGYFSGSMFKTFRGFSLVLAEPSTISYCLMVDEFLLILNDGDVKSKPST